MVRGARGGVACGLAVLAAASCDDRGGAHATRAPLEPAFGATVEDAGSPLETAPRPAEPKVPKRVQRGGSFSCTRQYCSRYLVGARGKGDAASAASHLGFRCVR